MFGGAFQVADDVRKWVTEGPGTFNAELEVGLHCSIHFDLELRRGL
jgi:hypothetical protein